ncbi:MAG: hypothetical protein QXU93_11630 [Thermoproteus sp.]
MKKSVRKKWGKVEVELEPASLEGVNCVYVDVFSVAAAFSDKAELFRGFAEFPGRAVFVLDAWHESHMPLARRYRELCGRWAIECVLSEDRPAEEKAVELACREGCAVLTRDFDAVRRARELGCDAPVLIFNRGQLWRARL